MTLNENSNIEFLSDWLEMPGWTIKEQAALLLLLNPDDNVPENKMVMFRHLLRVLTRAQEMRILKSPMAPSLFLVWAMNNPLPVPVPEILRTTSNNKEFKKWRKLDTILDIKVKKQVKSRFKKPGGPSLKTAMSAILAMAVEKYHYRPGHTGSVPENIRKTIEKQCAKAPTRQTVSTLLAYAASEISLAKKSK